MRSLRACRCRICTVSYTHLEDVENYDLMLNTAKLGVDGTVEAIKDYIRRRGFVV